MYKPVLPVDYSPPAPCSAGPPGRPGQTGSGLWLWALVCACAQHAELFPQEGGPSQGRSVPQDPASCLSQPRSRPELRRGGCRLRAQAPPPE